MLTWLPRLTRPRPLTPRSRFAEALLGVPTLRAYRCQPHFIALSDDLMERNAEAFVTQKLAAGWLASRLDVLGLAVLTICGRGRAGLEVHRVPRRVVVGG